MYRQHVWMQARFAAAKVCMAGETREFVRTGDEGGVARFQFCPECGSTVVWRLDGDPDVIAIAVGVFADPNFPPPTRSVYEERQHPWAAAPENVEHYD